MRATRAGERNRTGHARTVAWRIPTEEALWTGAILLALLATSGVRADSAQAAPAAAPVEEPAAEAPAPPPESGPFDHVRWGAALEAYYEYNRNRPYDRINQLRAYDTRANTFGIQQAAVTLESAVDVERGRRFGARLDFQFGQATETVQGSPANEPRPDVYRQVWQAFGTYVFPVGRGLQTDLGKFASNLGFETNYAKDNYQFSRAYLFNFLPFYHTGLRLTLPVGDKVTLMYMLTNGIQQTEEFNDYKSHHLTAIFKPVTDLSWTSSYYFGREQPDGGLPDGPDGAFRVLDSYVAYSVTPRLALGLDLNYTTGEVQASDPAKSLKGAGAYARYQLTTPAALALRYEHLDDEGLFAGIEQVLQEVTATLEYRLDPGLLVRAEVRRDWSDADFFNGSAPGDVKDHQDTLLVGAAWSFGNEPGAW